MPYTLDTTKMSEKEAASRVKAFYQAITNLKKQSKENNDDSFYLTLLPGVYNATVLFFKFLSSIESDLTSNSTCKAIVDYFKPSRNISISEYDGLIDAIFKGNNPRTLKNMKKEFATTHSHLQTSDGTPTAIYKTDICKLILQLETIHENKNWYGDLKRRIANN